MKRTALLLCLATISSTVFAADKPAPQINSFKDAEASGIYWAGSTSGEKALDQVPTPPRLVYVIDTKAQICYAAFFTYHAEPKTSQGLKADSVVVVPCSQLKNRPEWKEKITWND